jgi:hypothetical protein
MKILSNFKDYYDFIAGIYGIDDTIVYERHHQTVKHGCYNWDKKEYENKNWEKVPISGFSDSSMGLKTSLIALCDKTYFVAKYKGKFYFGEDAKFILNEISDKWVKSRFKKEMSYHSQDTNINETEKCPILLIDNNGSEIRPIAKNIRLSDFGFGSFIEPLTIFTSISEFLTKEKPFVDNRTNIEKLQSFGFDKVTSFRNM